MGCSITYGVYVLIIREYILSYRFSFPAREFKFFILITNLIEKTTHFNTIGS